MSRFADRSGPIRLGMVGGGQGAMIGSVHRVAARLDGAFTLTAGALSSTPEKAQASGREVGLSDDRIYSDYTQMAQREARLKDGIEAVAIVTPNHMHAPVAREFLKRGIHVICDKPLTATLAEAKKLKALADKSDALFVLTHNYTGYPLVREARARVAAGELGDIRVVQVEYPQDWLANAPAPDNKQAEWRTDPARSGPGGSTGDIGTHAWNLSRFVTGLQPEALAADLHSFVDGRLVDDNAHVMIRYQGGARGMLWCSQVAAGQENALHLRVFGTKAGLEWFQEDPNALYITPIGGPQTRITRGSAQTGDAAARMTRIPAGHPEGFFEAFANIYSEAATAIRARRSGVGLPEGVTFPTIDDGVEGVAFVDACVRSSKRNAAWVTL
ncbi:Gfo/Idh/MocA family protein [Puniceibacterium sp. IMCC21224]|uniref:Gfo/Idh/MocA family protein n=1 Tax=Puniceibacterium sp. IMCC21224 TaxID=1618204 RepID=UPI00064DEC86|nr:Gfo/Idh/MocA family oxidoreductase [Puniceibacterium sp. IMCC21224]KMK66232.1 putative dehydrogenase [Puniceibacterium sp. IMCC21224]